MWNAGLLPSTASGWAFTAPGWASMATLWVSTVQGCLLWCGRGSESGVSLRCGSVFGFALRCGSESDFPKMKSAIKMHKKLYNFDIPYLFCRTGQDISAGVAGGDNQAAGDGSRHAHCRPSRHFTSHLLAQYTVATLLPDLGFPLMPIHTLLSCNLFGGSGPSFYALTRN